MATSPESGGRIPRDGKLLRIERNHRRPEVAEQPIEQRLCSGSVSPHDHPGKLQQGGRKDEADRIALDGRQQAIRPLFALQDRNQCRRVDDRRLARKAVFIVTQQLLIGAHVEHGKLSHAFLHASHPGCERIRASATRLARETFLKRSTDRLRDGFSRGCRQRTSESIGFLVLDAERHGVF